MNARVLQDFSRELRARRTATLVRFASLQAQGDTHARATLRRLRACLVDEAPPSTEVLAAGLELLMRTDLRPVLGAIDAPALLVHGERDEIVRREAAEYLRDHLAHADLALVADAGHAPFVSHCERVRDLLVGFCDE